MSDLNMSLGKISDFVSFPLFGFTLVIKLRNFNFESHWNTLIIFDKKRYVVRFEYVPWIDVWFCFISIVWVHLSHKTKKFWFWRSTLFFDKKDNVKLDYVLSNNVWFGLSFVVWVKFLQQVEKYGFQILLK